MFIKLILLGGLTAYMIAAENFQAATSMTNKDKAIAINQAVQSGDTVAIASLVKENYIQHTPGIPDGRQGLVGLVTKIRNKEIPAPKITNVRIFEDGEFVVLHHDLSWPARKAMFEIFRFEDGLAAEHWSGIMDHPATTANGHSMLDGANVVLDKKKHEKKQRVCKGIC
jgi:predicted SnoaL-like aldol condensation-catalyzing enzyme